MTRAEKISLAKIHGDKLAMLTIQLSEMVRKMELTRAADLLPTVQHEMHTLAGYVAGLLPKTKLMKL